MQLLFQARVASDALNQYFMLFVFKMLGPLAFVSLSE